MKRIFISLLLAVCTICMAQTQHMKFKGVPMEGSIREFANQLSKKGFTSLGVDNGVALLSGEFASYKGCTIGAVSDQSGMVCKVVVIFPEMDKWGDLEHCYMIFKSMLSEKYGKPKECTELFQDKYVDDDSDRLYAVKFDQCKYISAFTGDNGEIKLEITHQRMSCFVRLTYYDNANQEALRKQIMEDL